jgi:hypothetical protein
MTFRRRPDALHRIGEAARGTPESKGEKRALKIASKSVKSGHRAGKKGPPNSAARTCEKSELSRSEKLGRGGTSDELVKPLNVIQRV